MFNTLLFIHFVIAILLVVVILFQKTSTDGLSGIGGSGSGMGVISSRSAANFFTRATSVLTVLFFVNALILANLSSKKNTNISTKLEQTDKSQEHNSKESEQELPLAK